MSHDLDAARRWEIPDRIRFELGPGGLIRAAIQTPRASALIYLLGAHVAEYQPAGEAAVLFMSAKSAFADGMPIRGGVPVIFPWFGLRAGDPATPIHGCVRTLAWKVENAGASENEVTLTLRLASNDETRARWPHDFLLRHRITIGSALEMALEVENRSPAEFRFEEALHTYFAVSDVREVAVTGLAGGEFIDKTDAFKRKRQDAVPIRITGETDRVYPGTSSPCVIDDPGLHRRIVIEKSGSNTTVVWNPWIAKAAAMTDFADDEWPRMLCVETANSGDDAVTLGSGQSHTMRAIIRTEPSPRNS